MRILLLGKPSTGKSNYLLKCMLKRSGNAHIDNLDNIYVYLDHDESLSITLHDLLLNQNIIVAVQHYRLLRYVSPEYFDFIIIFQKKRFFGKQYYTNRVLKGGDDWKHSERVACRLL